MAKLDYSKIFIKEACPTSIGGQAIMEGVMMQGPDRTAIAMRMPSGELYLRTKKKGKASPAMKIPFVRGIVAFVNSLLMGMSTLMESADILEEFAPDQYAEEPGRLEKWITKKFGDKAAWNFLMTSAVVFAVAVSLFVFVILPTWAVNFFGKWISSAVVLNLIEGLLRIAIFIAYVAAIRKMDDIMNLFRYHGAEHKSIHCFENGLELTPENAAGFYTLHPRCGTSFLVFVLIVSLLLFSFLGWPNLLWRIVSRILLIPVIAGISYELLKWAGRSDSRVVRILSWPGLMLQKLTTAEPTTEQLEVGLLSLKAVLVDPSEPEISGFVDKDGKMLRTFIDESYIRGEDKEDTAGRQDAESADKEGKDTPDEMMAPEEPQNNAAARPVIKDSGEAAARRGDTAEAGSAAEIEAGAAGSAGAAAVWADRRKALLELKSRILGKLRLDIKPLGKDKAEYEDLWKEGSGALGNKMTAVGTPEPSDEEAIAEAIKFLSELDKDGYTIVTPEECDGKTIAKAIAEHFAEDARARTLARRYTNDITTIENALKWGQAALSMVENGRNEAQMILSYATGMSRTELVTRAKELMKDEDFAVFEKKIQARLTGTPLQYILGMTEFMGVPIRVNPSVLIPRLDTEVVVEKALEIMKEKNWAHPDVLDMCTGSGAIGIAIAARVPEAIVTMTDSSEDALRTAMGNAGLNKVNRRCVFLLGDMFDALPEERVYDMIVCNPPYIESKVIDTLAIEVRDHEPRAALDGGEDGLDYYRIIADQASSHLRSGGVLVLEIGADQAGNVKRLLGRAGTYESIYKQKDFAGNDRVIIAERR